MVPDPTARELPIINIGYGRLFPPQVSASFNLRSAFSRFLRARGVNWGKLKTITREIDQDRQHVDQVSKSLWAARSATVLRISTLLDRLHNRWSPEAPQCGRQVLWCKADIQALGSHLSNGNFCCAPPCAPPLCGGHRAGLWVRGRTGMFERAPNSSLVKIDRFQSRRPQTTNLGEQPVKRNSGLLAGDAQSLLKNDAACRQQVILCLPLPPSRDTRLTNRRAKSRRLR
jgi:hypothetical protein